MGRTHEGKACDAVIRRIEAREGHSRSDLTFPEKKQDWAAAVEVTCRIGDQLFAFEHTTIEPFERHLELEARASVHFQPIQDRLAGRLPASEQFELLVPVTASLDLKGRELRKAQNAIVEWVAATASSLPIAPLGRYVTPIQYTTLPDVPFDVALARMADGVWPGKLRVAHLVSGDREEKRFERIRKAYDDKSGKLAAWRRRGARSVLILEEQDRQTTNHFLVADAVQKVEGLVADKPDEIYLLSTVIENSWTLWALRVGDCVYDDLSISGDSLSQIDPTGLVNVTGR
jgi:hypothetical protein